MAFDAIETTVANALLLKAQMGETEPIIFKTKAFSDLATYTESLLKDLSLSGLLQEPLGKFCFSRFLTDVHKDALLQICSEIRLIRSSSGKGKRSRGLKIIEILSEGTARKAPTLPPVVSASLLNTPAVAAIVNDASVGPNSSIDKDNLNVANKHMDVKLRPASSADAPAALPTTGEQPVANTEEKAKVNDKEHAPNPEKRSESAQKVPSEHGPHDDHNSLDDSGDEDAAPNKFAPPKLDLSLQKAKFEEKIASAPRSLNQDKALDRIIKIEGQVINEVVSGPDQQTSPVVAATTEAVALESKAQQVPAGWSTTYTKDIPFRALEAMADAVVQVELLESDYMMHVFDLIYSTLYTQLANEWFPKFKSSGQQFETYVCHREYAETTKVGFEQFQMFRALGKGAFGMVSAVQKKDSKKVYAMKAMSKKKIKHYHSEKLCEIEKAALQKVDSPFVLNLKYSFTNEKFLFLVLELCNGGDLQFHLTEVRGHRFPENRAVFYAAELILALEHLHKKKFVYRDLKPGNILIDHEGHVILSDLGLVHRISSKRPLRTLAGTSGYWAPEVMRRQVYDYSADWWSFGIFLHKLLSGRRPRCDCKKPKQWCPFGTKKEHADMAKANEPMTFELTFDDLVFSKNSQDILRRLLEPDPTKRLGANGADEVKKHPFFSDIQWLDLSEKLIEPPFKPTRNDINAVSLGEISSEGDRKFKKVTMDDKDEKFYERWDYVSVRAVQEEIVQAFEHNLELLKNPPKKPPPKEASTGCCIIL